MRDWRYLNMRNIGRTISASHPLLRFGERAAISSARERIGAELELHDSGPVLLAAFDVEHRPGGVGRPQRPSLPAGVRIVDTPFGPLGVEAHRIRNAQRDPFAF